VGTLEARVREKGYLISEGEGVVAREATARSCSARSAPTCAAAAAAVTAYSSAYEARALKEVREAGGHLRRRERRRRRRRGGGGFLT
jgi:hypothetical protein